MIRNLKILGLASMAILAISAAVASTALAGTTTGKVTAPEPVTLKGTPTGNEADNGFTAFGTQIKCPKTTYTGHKISETPHKFIASGSSEITITPHFDPICSVGMNGCDFAFRDITTTGGVEHTYGVVLDIVCPTGKEILIGGPACDVFIPAQTGLQGAHLKTTTTGTHDIDLEGKFEGITAKSCLGLHTTNAMFDVDVTIKGYNVLDEVKPITITH
jgi:hypothetical protein